MSTPIKVTDLQGNKLVEGVDYTIEDKMFTNLTNKPMNITWYSEKELTFNRQDRRKYKLDAQGETINLSVENK